MKANQRVTRIDGLMYITEAIAKRSTTPKRILRNNDATIVFWCDGSKTVVKRKPEDADIQEYAFLEALGKKVFGSHSAITKYVEMTEYQKGEK